MKFKFGKKPTTGSETPQTTNSLAKRIVIGIICLIVILLVVIGLQAYHYFKEAMQPLDPHSERVTEVKIPIGSTNKQIGSILEDKKIIKSGFVFDYYVKKHNLNQFRAGYYEFKPSMTLGKIAKKLEKGGASQSIKSGKVLVREGVTADQIGDVIQTRTKYSKASFLKLLNDQQFVKQLAKKYPNLLTSAVKAKNVRYRLEGYLYPATYYLNKNESLKSLVEEMVAKSDQMLTPYYAQIKKKNWTVQKVLTLASLVEREGVTANDRYRIAGVFENRLDDGMMIQSDISVLYALGKHQKNVSYKDLKTKSPYNLYLHRGVGPGPFNNPSIASVNAVLNPADREQHYLYFIANMKTGKVYYSKTYAEHQALTKKLAKQNN
ncbi:MAG: endolytic transglycosylase MltG [Liquorilactobacillus ghanensis]|uniref:endolytic transglycosylase MltG n=1 Tax=Liquorilactobacillus ghanensis TaxID=399370 RepID=UPI0039E867A8